MSIKDTGYLLKCIFLIAGSDKEKLQSRIRVSGQLPEVGMKTLVNKSSANQAPGWLSQ